MAIHIGEQYNLFLKLENMTEYEMCDEITSQINHFKISS
jgi:hypothetical protein